MRTAALAGLLLLPAATAAGGGPDRAFGARGVRISPDPIGGRDAAGYGIVEDSEKRLVVAGVVMDSSGVPHMALWRFRGDGRPDSAYGRGGVAVSTEAGWAWGLALDARGRAAAAGSMSAHGKPSAGAPVERFLADGRRDPSFGCGGRVVLRSPLGGPVAEAGAAALAEDGGVLVGGHAGDRTDGVRAALWRLKEDGALDTRFGTGGALLLPGPPGQAEPRVSALHRLPDGDWLAAGTFGWKELALWRVSADGKLRAGFGSGGLARSDGAGRGIADDGAGGAWVGGFSYAAAQSTATVERAVLARFAADGSTRSLAVLDAGPFRDREAFAVVRAGDGRLFLSGYADSGRRPVSACLWGLTSDGVPDRRFGRAGVLLLPGSAPGGEDRIYALTLDSEGRLIAAGLSRDADGRRSLAVWRIKL
ncbi:MAG: hypothetical protein NTY77_17280 [Elusimicrobia bacterium]|nr:hypothetical protein [Elusimicrobiota bacterium]